MLKKILCTAMLSLLCVTNVCAAKKIQVTINDRAISFDKNPIIINDRTMIPLRGLFENLGYTIDWFAEEKTAVISNTDISIKISPDSYTYTVNDKIVTCDVPAQLVDNSLYLPLRTIIESTDLSLEWNEATNTVAIYTSDSRSLALQNTNQYLEDYSSIMSAFEEKKSVFDNLSTGNIEVNAETISQVIDCKNILRTAYDEVKVLKATGALKDIKLLHLSYIEKYIEFCDIIIEYNNDTSDEATFKKEIKYINSEISILNTKIINAFSKI